MSDFLQEFLIILIKRDQESIFMRLSVNSVDTFGEFQLSNLLEGMTLAILRSTRLAYGASRALFPQS